MEPLNTGPQLALVPLGTRQILPHTPEQQTGMQSCPELLASSNMLQLCAEIQQKEHSLLYQWHVINVTNIIGLFQTGIQSSWQSNRPP